jgi:hypothetical protein
MLQAKRKAEAEVKAALRNAEEARKRAEAAIRETTTERQPALERELEEAVSNEENVWLWLFQACPTNFSLSQKQRLETKKLAGVQKRFAEIAESHSRIALLRRILDWWLDGVKAAQEDEAVAIVHSNRHHARVALVSLKIIAKAAESEKEQLAQRFSEQRAMFAFFAVLREITGQRYEQEAFAVMENRKATKRRHFRLWRVAARQCQMDAEVSNAKRVSEARAMLVGSFRRRCLGAWREYLSDERLQRQREETKRSLLATAQAVLHALDAEQATKRR